MSKIRFKTNMSVDKLREQVRLAQVELDGEYISVKQSQQNEWIWFIDYDSTKLFLFDPIKKQNLKTFKLPFYPGNVAYMQNDVVYVMNERTSFI